MARGRFRHAASVGGATWMVALLLVAGCTTDADSGPGDGTAVEVPEDAALMSTADVAEIVAGQLQEQVGGQWTVTCPTSQAAVPGATFSCEASGPGDLSATVSVTPTDAVGGFDWRTADSGSSPSAS